MCIITVMKKFLVMIVLFLGIVVVVLSFSELKTIMHTLQKAHLEYFVLAILTSHDYIILFLRNFQEKFRIKYTPMLDRITKARKAPFSCRPFL